MSNEEKKLVQVQFIKTRGEMYVYNEIAKEAERTSRTVRGMTKHILKEWAEKQQERL